MEIRQLRSILDKVMDNTATESELKMISTLLDSEEGQRLLSEQMDEDLRQIESGADETRTREVVVNAYGKIASRMRSQRWLRYAKRVVAVVVPILLIGYAAFWVDHQIHIFSPVEYVEIAAEKGEHVQVALQDGTRVWLSGGSKIKYPSQFKWNERRAQLSGEAFFDVKSDSQRGFVLDLPNGAIKVYGTKFNVSSYLEDSLSLISLSEGSISFQVEDKDYHLSPGQQLVYNRNSGRVTIGEPKGFDKIMMRKNNVLTFDRTPLTEVLTTLNRWYGVDFDIENEKAKALTFTYSSNDQQLTAILNDLQMISPLAFKEENGRVKIFMK
ncbi:MAG: DUF4974 domain-containing protein [Bacteroidales bacterium]|nr:DUF4974 domain-containing protein [Bacteroidales bacterium]